MKTTNWIDDVYHQVSLIKNNPSILIESKREINNLIDFFLNQAKVTADYDYLIYRFSLLKDSDSGVNKSSAIEALEVHIRRHK
jgi:hypothetical protein